MKRERPKRPARTKAVIEEELACCIAALLGIPREHAKLLTAEQIRSLVNFDHIVHHAIGGKVVHHNLTMRTILDHREKTHTIDRPQIRKTDRLEDAHKAFQARLLAKGGQDAPEPVPSKPKAKIRSAGFRKPPPGHKYNWGSKR